MKMNIFSSKKEIFNPLKKVKNSQLQAALLAVIISSIVWLGTSLYFSLAPFGTKTLCTLDGTDQYMPFLSEFWSIFNEGGSLLYSFHGGLGNNFYLTCAYYLFSPFTFLALLFNKSQIPIAANLIVILKNILVITIMAWYLASKSEKPRPFLATSIALAYGLSYYFLSYSFNFMWMDGIALVPLMLYGMERLNTRKGRLFYIISLALAILTNFYMGAVICIFLALYYIVIHLRFNTHEGWKDFKAFALCSICAALIGGIVLIPVVKVLVSEKTGRMESPNFEFYNNAKYFFSRFLPQAKIVKISSNRGTINLYMGVGAIFGLLLFLFTKQSSKREKYGLLFLIGLYLLSTQFSLLNYVFHGFYMQGGVPNRYAFVINLLIGIAIYQSFSNLQQDSSKKIIWGGVISTWYFGVIGAWNSSDSLWLALSLLFVVLLYWGLTYYKKIYLLSWLILIESLYGLTMLSPGYLNSMFTQMNTYEQVIESISSTGRTEYIGKNIVRNSNALFGTNGVTAFNSVINSNTASFFGKLGCDWNSVRYFFFRGWTPISALFFGVKDLISNSDVLVPPPYSYKEKIDNITLYESPYNISFGVIPISNQDINEENKFQNLNILYPDSFSLLDVEATVKTSEEISKVQTYSKSQTYNRKYQINDVKENGETIIKLDPFEGENIYIYTYMNGSSSYKVFKNDEELSSTNQNGVVVYVGSVKTSDEVTVKYKASADASYRVITVQVADLSVAKTNEAGVYYSSHCLQNQKIAGSTITGFYETSSNENMVFTLPYDEGWSAYVNGQRVSISSWQNAFLSIPLQAGTNEIKLIYFPLGLKEGIGLSLSGLLLLWFILKKI